MVPDDSRGVEIVAASSHEPRVLVAEDQALTRWALGQALARVGFRVVAAEGREEACGHLYAMRFDAVVMSGVLAGRDMTDVIDGLARFQPQTRLIVLCEDDGLAGRMARIPGATVFLKPFEMRALLAAVLGASAEPSLLSA
jgi:DNA-binding NtrC family response regulator